MTSENFEKYIALLKGLLKLGKAQEEEIASELQDHLEHRTEQLIREGKSVEEAETIAIKEFGDAAGMASSFINISRIKRRRWMMRFTTFAIAGSFLVALFVMNMWPANGPMRLPIANAQEKTKLDDSAKNDQGDKRPPRSSKKQTKMTTVSRVRSEAEEHAIESLDRVVKEFNVDELPLSEAIQQLSNEVHTPIIISKRYLEDSGLDPDQPVTLQMYSAKLTTILDMIMSDQLGLTDWAYGVKDSVVFVSGDDNIHSLMEVRVYDCSDFAITATVKVPVFPGGYGFGGGGSGFSGGLGGGGSGGGMFCIPPQLGNQAGGFGGGGLGGGLGGRPQEGPDPKIVEGGSKQVKTEKKPEKDDKESTTVSVGYKTYQLQDLDEVIDCITMTVDAESWESYGGVATLNQVGSALVIKQSIANHSKIEELLMMLRKAKQ